MHSRFRLFLVASFVTALIGCVGGTPRNFSSFCPGAPPDARKSGGTVLQVQYDRVVVRPSERDAPIEVLVSPAFWQQTSPNAPAEQPRAGDRVELNWAAADCDEQTRRVRATQLRKI